MRFGCLRNRRAGEGQALVEFALVLPMFAMFVFVVIQLGIVFLAYHSETRMARETARWLAVNSSSTDDAVAAHVQSTMLPGLVNGTISANMGDTTNAIYDVGTRMTVTFTACGASVPPCTNANRAPGSTLGRGSARTRGVGAVGSA